MGQYLHAQNLYCSGKPVGGWSVYARKCVGTNIGGDANFNPDSGRSNFSKPNADEFTNCAGKDAGSRICDGNHREGHNRRKNCRSADPENQER